MTKDIHDASHASVFAGPGLSETCQVSAIQIEGILVYGNDSPPFTP
jgi:hypothetical protein